MVDLEDGPDKVYEGLSGISVFTFQCTTNTWSDVRVPAETGDFPRAI